MRSRELHHALRAFALDAAAALTDAQRAGAELEFDLDEGRARRRGPTLYHFRPLTEKFIADRWPGLRELPTCRAAAEQLGAGAAAYLPTGVAHGAEAEPALQAMLERLYEDLTELSFPEERFERVYAELERTLFEDAQIATVLAPVHGLELPAERVELGDGVWLGRGDCIDAPAEAVWGGPGGRENPAGSEPNAVVALTCDVAPGEPLPADHVGRCFRRVLTGLRLWKAGGVALGAVAWRRTGEGRWQPFEIGATGEPRGEPWILVDGEAHELREFLAALDKGSVGTGTTAWALARFEMGLGRGLHSEALSDYLLALRALLDAGADEAHDSLGLRLAVLCAEEHERKRTQRRVELALALERSVMAGGREEGADGFGAESPRTLVDELERHLRALLRDLVCGYLDPDLRALADDLLLDEPEYTPEADPAALDAEEGAEPAPVDVGAEIQALEDEPEDVSVAQPEFDWDDPEGYSAPV